MIPTWYRDAIIYQVDARLFLDSTGDGWGDLAGLRRRLHHLRGLGVNCIWLLPFYPTPLEDGGYDITDHVGVDPRVGGMPEVVELVQQADELGIRVLVDLVVQHTSAQHPWFRSAREDRGSPYRDYYIWADEPHESDIEPIFPGVEDSVWAWDDKAGQYYRHAFYSHEPDLNFTNPHLRHEVERIVEFWVQMGVSGFRIDGAPYLVEQTRQVDDRDGVLWWFNDLYDFVATRRPGAVLLGEVDVPVEQYADYFGGGHRINMLLNFWVNNHLFLALARQQAGPLVKAIDDQPPPPAQAQYANWLRNHDELDLGQLSDEEQQEVFRAFAPREDERIYGRGIRRRLAPMLDGDADRLAMAHALLLSLPGAPVLRYGDEIGMGDDLSLTERRAVRTAMQWSGEQNAGFSPAAADALRVPLISGGDFGYQWLNVYDQVLDEGSLLARVGNLGRTRAGLPQLGSGQCVTFEVDDGAVLALRHGEDDAVVTLVNLSDREVEFDLPDLEGLSELVDVLGDQPYDRFTSDNRRVRLGRYGYRWLRSQRHLVD